MKNPFPTFTGPISESIGIPLMEGQRFGPAILIETARFDYKIVEATEEDLQVLESLAEAKIIPREIISEAKQGKLMVVEGRFQHADIKNANGRIYPDSLWEKVMSDRNVIERVNNREMFGELDHPEDGETKLQRSSHIVTKLVKESKEINGRAVVMNTDSGRNLRAIFEAGGRVGVSSRGKGSVVHESGADVVQDDFVLETFDMVYNPSTPGAYPRERDSHREATGQVDLEPVLVLSEATSVNGDDTMDAKAALKQIQERFSEKKAAGLKGLSAAHLGLLRESVDKHLDDLGAVLKADGSLQVRVDAVSREVGGFLESIDQATKKAEDEGPEPEEEPIPEEEPEEAEDDEDKDDVPGEIQQKANEKAASASAALVSEAVRRTDLSLEELASIKAVDHVNGEKVVAAEKIIESMRMEVLRARAGRKNAENRLEAAVKLIYGLANRFKREDKKMAIESVLAADPRLESAKGLLEKCVTGKDVIHTAQTMSEALTEVTGQAAEPFNREPLPGDKGGNGTLTENKNTVQEAAQGVIAKRRESERTGSLVETTKEVTGKLQKKGWK
ncbi:hypothetical protein LCGC14_1252880 [marine sediment metagenome]|uniref:Uncharacterized protein n=1 Tax=marine sediment metagenome TaxID=412755 RepID=A0A0F9L2P6_9ZZZZ